MEEVKNRGPERLPCLCFASSRRGLDTDRDERRCFEKGNRLTTRELKSLKNLNKRCFLLKTSFIGGGNGLFALRIPCF